MSVRMNPYLNFHGDAREAMSFYQSVFGGELTMNTFAEFGMPTSKPEEGEYIMHAQLETPDGFTLMGADATSEWEFARGRVPYAVSLSGEDTEKLTTWWERLSDLAEVDQPLSQAPWGDSFGSLVDRFGVNWLVNIIGTQQD